MSENNPEFVELQNAIRLASKIVISTHVQPDGDGLGAETALYHYLKRAGKEVRVHNPDPLPGRYRFLDSSGEFLLSPTPDEAWSAFDLWIIVDTNDPRRLGPVWSALKDRAKKILFLDHHPDLVTAAQELPRLPAHALIVSDVRSSSIGELLYQLFLSMNLVPIHSDLAVGLYVSVMTDTNSFRYARTTPESHRIAAHMIELGVNPEEVYQQIYSTKELSHVQLLGIVLQNTRTSQNGRLAWMEMRLDLRRQFRASADDTMSFLNLLLLLRDTDIVCLFREEDDGRTVRVSIKSKGKIVVNQVAMDLGGGGHEYAAGVALREPFEKVVETVTGRLETLIANSPDLID